MTHEELPEKLRNLPGMQMYDPTKTYKIVLSEAKTEEFAKKVVPLLKLDESA